MRLTLYIVDVVLSVYVMTVLVQRYCPADADGIEEDHVPAGIAVPKDDT